MEFKIQMKREVHDEIFTLMRNIKDINGGDEIGGWVLGDWHVDGNTATLILDEFVIPKQEVSKTEVDISPTSMTDTLKELGPERCNRIKAHWHIHPFGTGKTNWSGIDEDKIKDFMEPQTGREIFVFLLSSEDWMKARVELNMKTTLLGKEVNVKRTIDDLEVETEKTTSELSLFEKLKLRVEEKVSKHVYKYNQTTLGGATSKKEEIEEMLFSVIPSKKRITLEMDKDFHEFISMCQSLSVLLGNPDVKKYTPEQVIYIYHNKNKKELKELEDRITDEINQLAEEYETTQEEQWGTSKCNFDNYPDDYFEGSRFYHY